ncbi:hypothetical protein [Paraburkholderia caffeinilytica]|uniref:hypothetical protein n=1 Tax=Paraburkholderia caffeinilytica TaxID=1761016 RepID=UPI0038B73444
MSADDPEQRDVAVIASEAVIWALLDGSMKFEAASTAGLVIVDALPPEKARLLDALAESFGSGSPIFLPKYNLTEGHAADTPI